MIDKVLKKSGNFSELSLCVMIYICLNTSFYGIIKENTVFIATCWIIFSVIPVLITIYKSRKPEAVENFCEKYPNISPDYYRNNRNKITYLDAVEQLAANTAWTISLFYVANFMKGVLGAWGYLFGLVYVSICVIIAATKDDTNRLSEIKLLLLGLCATPLVLYAVLSYNNRNYKNTQLLAAELRAHLENSKMYLRNKDYANAIAECTEAIKKAPAESSGIYKWPQKTLLYEARAEIYLEQKDYMNAIADYTKLIDYDLISMSSSRWYLERAKLLRRIGDYEAAIRDYAEKFKDDDIYSLYCEEAVYEHLAIYILQEKYQAALDFCNHAISRYSKTDYNPDDQVIANIAYPAVSFIYLQRALIHRLLGDDANALSDYDEIIELDLYNLDTYLAYMGRGDIQQKIGHRAGAEISYANAKDVPLSDYEKYLAYMALGDMHERLGDAEGAEAYYTEANGMVEKQ